MSDAILDVETFLTPWPGVLVEMKDYVDLRFLTARDKGRIAAVRIFISKALVPQSKLQPHVRKFRAAFSRIPDCTIELKGTEQPAHKIEIEYRR